MNTKRIDFEIFNGPNKDMLFDACKYAYSKTVKFAIDFGVAVGYTMPRNHPGCAYIPMDMHDVMVRGIEHEDGSGESFNIHGVCRAVLCGTSDNAKLYKFKAYYNAKTRTGTIAFE